MINLKYERDATKEDINKAHKNGYKDSHIAILEYDNGYELKKENNSETLFLEKQTKYNEHTIILTRINLN